jgi:hypothetical protein
LVGCLRWEVSGFVFCGYASLLLRVRRNSFSAPGVAAWWRGVLGWAQGTFKNAWSPPISLVGLMRF